MPTLLDLNGIQIPKRVTGESLRPLIESGDSSQRSTIYGGWNNHGFVRTPEYSYIGRWNPGEAYEEIYNPKADPLELTNIIQTKESLRDECRQLLKNYVDAGWETTRGSFIQADPQS
jgi:arylsulfatase A-like enzyme